MDAVTSQNDNTASRTCDTLFTFKSEGTVNSGRRCGTCRSYCGSDVTSFTCHGSTNDGLLKNVTQQDAETRCSADTTCIGYVLLIIPSMVGQLERGYELFGDVRLMRNFSRDKYGVFQSWLRYDKQKACMPFRAEKAVRALNHSREKELGWLAKHVSARAAKERYLERFKISLHELLHAEENSFPTTISSYMSSLHARMLVGEPLLRTLQNNVSVVNERTRLVHIRQSGTTPGARPSIRVPWEVHHDREGNRTVSVRQPHRFLFNPAVLDDANIFFKLSDLSKCGLETGEFVEAHQWTCEAAERTTVWVGTDIGSDPSIDHGARRVRHRGKVEHTREDTLAPAEPRRLQFSSQVGRPTDQRGVSQGLGPWRGDRATMGGGGRFVVRGVFPRAEDARVVRLGRRIHLLFTRKGSYDRTLNKCTHSMHIGTIDDDSGQYKEVAVHGKRMGKMEKSWMPFTWNGSLYAYHTLCPPRVLRCDPDTGSCADVHHTARAPPGCDGGLRGGSAFVRAHGALLGVAHRTHYMKSSMRRVTSIGASLFYQHHLIRVQGEPPFMLLNVSAPFIFPRLFQTSADWIQFCVGLALDSERAEISYGVGDCAAMAVTMPRADFLRFAGVRA